MQRPQLEHLIRAAAGMTFDLQRILEGKRAYRQRLAALPLVEKLRMLDALRERALTQRRATGRQESGPDALREPHAPWRTQDS